MDQEESHSSNLPSKKVSKLDNERDEKEIDAAISLLMLLSNARQRQSLSTEIDKNAVDGVLHGWYGRYGRHERYGRHKWWEIRETKLIQKDTERYGKNEKKWGRLGNGRTIQNNKIFMFFVSSN